MPIARAGDADIAYDVHGQGDPVLFVPGFATDARLTWMFQIPAVSQRYRCLALDNRGIGTSSGPLDGLTMESMASDALAVLDDAGVERAHVVGISMGGAIAQHVALKAPERVRSLTLAATWCRRNSYLPRMARAGNDLLAGRGFEAVAGASMLWLFTPRFIIDHGELLEGIEALAIEAPVDAAVFDAQQRAVLDHDVADRLATLEVPTLVIVGRRDIFVPTELSEDLAATIPGATLRVIEGGHAFNIEERDAFNAELLAFLDAN